VREPATIRRQLRSRRAARGGAVGTLLLVILGSSACYRYVPVPLAATSAKDEVRVRITEDAARRLTADLGAYTTELDGRFSPEGADSVSVAVPIVREYRGTMLESTTQVLYLARADVLDVRRRELSPARTALTTAGVLVGFGLMVRAIVQLTDPNPGSDDRLPPPPPPQSRIPLGHYLRLRIPIP
jgi:hypothetical protein